jgi:hypothetical protein
LNRKFSDLIRNSPPAPRASGVAERPEPIVAHATLAAITDRTLSASNATKCFLISAPSARFSER